jgi:hypothetical protein
MESGAQAQGIEKLEQPSSTERGEASTRKPPAHSPEPPEISLADRYYCEPPPTVLPVPLFDTFAPLWNRRSTAR